MVTVGVCDISSAIIRRAMMLMILSAYKQRLLKILLFSLGLNSFSFGSLCASTAHAPKYDNIQIWKFQLQNYWKQNAAISMRVAFSFGWVFVIANTLSKWRQLICALSAFVWFSDVGLRFWNHCATPFASIYIQYRFHWCCQRSFVVFIHRPYY